MPVLSLAEASRRLGVDPKTLRRWLALASLPGESPASEGRLKGVSSDALELVAHLHHRRLAPLPPEPPAPAAAERPELPAALLALPEALGTLQAQITMLQQQVADLTHLLQQHASPSAIPLAPQTRTAKRPPKPAPSAPRSRPAAQPPRKPVPVLPRVEYGSDGHYVVICPTRGLLPFEPDTPAWFAWLDIVSSFRFVGKSGHFSAHHESLRVPHGAWRAHRKIRNRNHILRLALSHELTIAVLEQSAAQLQALL